MTELELDGHVGAKDLPLPEGVSLRLAPNQTVLAVVSEKAQGEEEARAPPVLPQLSRQGRQWRRCRRCASSSRSDARLQAKLPRRGKACETLKR